MTELTKKEIKERLNKINIDKMITTFHMTDKPFNYELFDQEYRKIMLKSYHKKKK